MPHAGGWSEAGVLEAAERYQHPLLAVRGTAREPAQADPGPAAGLAIEGQGVVLARSGAEGTGSSCGSSRSTRPPTEADRPRRVPRKRGVVDLLGREGGALPSRCRRRSFDLPLGSWEIATVRLR